MVSKTLVCLVLLAVVAVCSCKPSAEKLTMKVEKQSRIFQQEKHQKIACSNSNANSNSDSNESNQVLCELTNQKQQKNRKNLQVQDSSSSSESHEMDGKKMKVLMSQEDNNSKEIRVAPKHQRMNQAGPEYMRGQQMRENVQKARRGNGDNNSNENNSRGEQNQINRQ